MLVGCSIRPTLLPCLSLPGPLPVVRSESGLEPPGSLSDGVGRTVSRGLSDRVGPTYGTKV